MNIELHSRPKALRAAGLGLAALSALLLAGCSLFQREEAPPVATPSTAVTPATSSAQQAQQAECERLRAAIRTAQVRQRQAPTISTEQNIVGAAQAKADRDLEDLRAQYDQQDCAAAALPSPHTKTPPLPAAPGGSLQ